MARGNHRFKDSLRGSIAHLGERLGSPYPCLVEDISQRGLYLVASAPVKIGDRMRIDLHISEDARFSCVIEIRQVTPEGLGAEVVDIAGADAAVLSDRIEKHCLAVRQAKARAASAVEQAARRREKIAARAYYHAERRGFDPAGQGDDWLKAEREIDDAENELRTDKPTRH